MATSVAYLADLAAFALDLVQRGQSAGALQRRTRASRILASGVHGPDIVALNSLIAAMPPVCRAESDAQDGHELATSALCAFADTWVRTRSPAGIELPPRRGRRPKHVPAEEAWLTALTAPDGRFDADPGELDDLAEALQPWDAIGADEPGPARAMFRLTETEEPDGQQPGWRLEFLLQSMADPSLLVPAEQTWDEDGSLVAGGPAPGAAAR